MSEVSIALKDQARAALAKAFWLDYSDMVASYLEAAEGLDLELFKLDLAYYSNVERRLFNTQEYVCAHYV
jgi:hypothetical protein